MNLKKIISTGVLMFSLGCGLGYKTGDKNGIKYHVEYMNGIGPGIDWWETKDKVYLDYYRDCTLDAVCPSEANGPCIRIYDDENKLIPYFKPTDKLVHRNFASEIQGEFDSVKNEYFGGESESTCRPVISN